MTTQEKMDLYLGKHDWLKTRAGRWALRKAMGDVRDTVDFTIDTDATMTVDGRVFYAVGKAAGLALRAVRAAKEALVRAATELPA